MTQTEIRPGVSRNTFDGGMIQDIMPEYMKSNNYFYALNAVHGSHDFRLYSNGQNSSFLVNEKSNELAASFSAKVVGISYIDERNQSLVFTIDNKISLFDHKTREVIELVDGNNYQNNDTCARDIIGPCWNFAKCEMMYAEFKTLQPCNELHAYFSSGCHYYVINIDELLDPARKAALTCRDFRLAKCTNNPHITPEVQETGGHGLESGAYYYVAQLEDKDNNKTNWFFVEGPASVGSDNNIPGEESKSVVELRIDCLDTRYNKIRVAVIRKIDGQVREPELIYSGGFSSNGTSIRHYSKSQGIETLSFEEIFQKRKTYVRGQDLFIRDGRLWLYRLRQERNLNYQRRANQIVGRVAKFEVAMEFAHLYPSLQRSEAYQPAIVWIYCDGTTSAAFPISPVGGPGGAPPNEDPDGGGPLGEATHLVAQTRASRDSNSAQSGGGSARGSSDEYTPNQLIRRRLPKVAGSYRSEAPTDVKPYSVPEDLKKETIDVEEKAAVDRFTTTVSDYRDATFIDEEAEKAQPCLCPDGPFAQCLDDIVDQEGNPCGNPAFCCGGSPTPNNPATNAVQEDFVDLEKSYINWSDWLADYGLDKEKPRLVSGSFRSAARRLFEQGVLQREVKMYVAGGYSESGGSGGSAKGSKSLKTGSAKHMDASGKETREGQPRFTGYASHKVKYTTNLYPDITDCEGERMYPTGPIPLFEMPSEAEEPLVKNTQTGVESPFTPDGSHSGDTYATLLGFEFSNIEFPNPAELPKPLSCTNPYKIVYVKRDDLNSSVIANGAFFGTYEGNVRGITHMFPRNGANSAEPVDRHIDNNGSRIGSNGPSNKYIFQSPDTNLRKPSLIATHVIHNGSVGGKGWRHGLYAKGKEPPVSQDEGTRVDNKGARHSLNLGEFFPAGGTRIDIAGIQPAPADRIVSATAGIDTPLMNKYRESAVYLQTQGQLPGLSGSYSLGSYSDRSFIGDVLDHAAPIEGEAWKGSIARDLPDQYGNVENQTYIDLGLDANKETGSTIRGYCGDVYIQMHSIRRTAWVSDKVGDEYNIPALVSHKEKWRTICDSPEDELFMYGGQDFYPTRLPETGDAADAKNWAGLHTNPSAFTRPARTRSVNLESSVTGAWESISEGYTPISDFYYPQVTKALVTFYAEGKVNGYYRQTGKGSQVETGKVYYPNLKDLALDAAAPSKHPWETAWLPRFYARVEQPSRHQIKMKAAIRGVLVWLLPMLGALAMSFIEPLTGITGFALTGGSMITIWQLLARNILNDQNLNRLLGFPVCKTDSEGTEDGAEIVNFEDNFFEYNSDHSSVNDLQLFYGMSENYYTCDCDNCELGETTNEILYSNKQLIDSQIDSFRNFDAFQFNTIDANAGKLMKLFTQGNNFYAHTTDNIWALQVRDATTEHIPDQIIVQPLQMLEDIKEGYMGTLDPNAGINTPYGYFFVNRESKHLVRFDRSGFDIISELGMFSFFKENLDFCTEGCTDEHISGRFYHMGWDHRNGRLLFTKKDGDTSYTISFDPYRKVWISFHSYIPDFYVWDQDHMYTVVEDKIYIHDDKDGDYQTFYGDYYPYEVEFVVNAETAFNYESSYFNTEAKLLKDNVKINDRPYTFNKAWYRNSTQSTGIIDLDYYVKNNKVKTKDITDYKDRATVTKAASEWHLNRMLDRVIDPNAPIINKDKCEVIESVAVNNLCTDCTDEQYHNNILFDKYLRKRLIFDNLECKNIELFLKNVDTLHKTHT
jgi:hypothetical protein